LQNVQAKLTYVGLTEKPVWSVGVTAPSQTFNLNQFAPFQRAASDYPGDEFELITCQATTAELASLITAAGTVTDVAAGVNDHHPNLSFSLVHHAQPGDSGFEAVLSAASATALLKAAIPSLDAGSDCQRVLRQFSETTGDGPGISQGDANCSGTITPLDALIALKFGAGLLLPNSCIVVGGDTNCDGEADAVDAIADLRFFAGLATLPPCPNPVFGTAAN
jgi:hypothetical protein